MSLSNLLKAGRAAMGFMKTASRQASINGAKQKIFTKYGNHYQEEEGQIPPEAADRVSEFVSPNKTIHSVVYYQEDNKDPIGMNITTVNDGPPIWIMLDYQQIQPPVHNMKAVGMGAEEVD